jgi:hypothetical protein
MTFNRLSPILAQGRVLEASIFVFPCHISCRTSGIHMHHGATDIIGAQAGIEAATHRWIPGACQLDTGRGLWYSKWDTANPLHEGLELVLATAISLEDQQLETLMNMSLADETQVMRSAERAACGLLFGDIDNSSSKHKRRLRVWHSEESSRQQPQRQWHAELDAHYARLL